MRSAKLQSALCGLESVQRDVEAAYLFNTNVYELLIGRRIDISVIPETTIKHSLVFAAWMILCVHVFV